MYDTCDKKRTNMKNASAFAFNDTSIGASMGNIGLVCNMPIPTEPINSAATATETWVLAFMVLNTPEEIMRNPQQDHRKGRYAPLLAILIPVANAKGMTPTELAIESTADCIGPTPLQAWKYKGK